MEREGNKNYIFSLLHGGRPEPAPEPTLHFDSKYFITLPGVLKSTQIIINLLIFITIIFSGHANLGRLSFLSLTAGIGFFTSTLLLGCHVMHVVDTKNKIPWMSIELGYEAIWTVLFAIGSTVCLLYIGYGVVFGIVPFFGYIDTIMYGYDCYLKYKIIKEGKRGQGPSSKA